MPKRNFEQGIGLLLLRLKNPVPIPQKHALMVDEASRDVDFR